jgi:hypothetical protein
MADAEPMPMTSTFMDYPEHERTYRAFTTAAKWGTVMVAIIVILLAFFLI